MYLIEVNGMLSIRVDLKITEKYNINTFKIQLNSFLESIDELVDQHVEFQIDTASDIGDGRPHYLYTGPRQERLLELRTARRAHEALGELISCIENHENSERYKDRLRDAAWATADFHDLAHVQSDPVEMQENSNTPTP